MEHSVGDLLSDFETELVEAQTQMRTLSQRVQFLQLTINGLRGLASVGEAERLLPMEVEPTESVVPSALAPAVAETSEYLRPRDAWLTLMREQPREWSVDQVEKEMVARNWLAPGYERPTEAIRAAGRRLADVEHLLLRVKVSSFVPATNGTSGNAYVRSIFESAQSG